MPTLYGAQAIVGAMVRQHFGSRFYLNAYILMAVRFSGTALGFLFWILAARLAGGAEFVGMASATISAAALLAGLSQLGLGYALVRYLPLSERPASLVNRTLSTVGVASLCLGVVFLLGIPFWSPALAPLAQQYASTLVFLLLVAAYALSLCVNWVFLGRRRPVYTLLRQLVQTVTAVILLVALARQLDGFLLLVAVYMLAMVTSLLAAIVLFIPRVEAGYRFRLRLPASPATRFNRYALANFLTDQFYRAPDRLMPLLIVNLLGADRAAYFFVAWTIATGLGALSDAFATSLFAEGCENSAELERLTRKAMKVGLTVGFAVVVGTLVAGNPLLFAFGPAYAAGGYSLLVLLAVATIPGLLLSIQFSVLRVENRLSRLARLSLWSLLTGIVLVLFGALYGGLAGAGLGWLASRVIVLFLSLSRVDRSTSKQFGQATPSG